MTGDLPDLLASQAALSPRRIALDEPSSGRRLDYAGLDSRAARAAAVMAAHGVREGDRVGIACANRIAFFEILFGCARMGAILVPLNWRMPPAELAPIVADASPSLLFHDAERGTAIRSLGARCPLVDLDEDYERLISLAAPVQERRRWPADAIWYLIYTSGTTGQPKGVIYNFRMALVNAVNIGSATALSSADTVASFLPLFHTAGINLHALPALFGGARVVLLERFDAGAVIDLLRARQLDLFFAVPTVYRELADDRRFAAAPLDAVRHWACGGAPLCDDLARRYRELGIRICNGMGMTETGPTAFLMDPEDAWDRIGSIGKPQLLVEAKLVDQAGRPAAPGQVGEILFSGPGVTPGYWRDEAATRSAFTSDGWLRSGDLGRRDEDGFYYLAGRRKEMFISGGENVYPIEVENVLTAHPAIDEAAVVAAADAQWGEVGRAYIRLAAGAAPPSPADLATFCRERLAPYKVPRAYQLVRDFPRTPAGKILKKQLAPAGAEIDPGTQN